MNSTFSKASQSEVFKLLYSTNWKSGFNNPHFVFRKRKNGKYRSKFLKNIEISFKENVFKECTGIVMIIEDLIKNETVTSKFLKRNVSRDVKDLRFSLKNFDDLYSEAFYNYPDVDPINTFNVACFKNGEDKPFEINFLFINGDLHFSAYPLGGKFVKVNEEEELKYEQMLEYLTDIEDFHFEHWNETLNMSDNSYFKL